MPKGLPSLPPRELGKRKKDKTHAAVTYCPDMPWWGTTLLGLGCIVLGSVLTWLNMRRSNRHNLVLKERAELYIVLMAQARRYLKDVPVDPDLVADAELDARLTVYASQKIKDHWQRFRADMEPLGAGPSIGRMVQAALDAPADMSVDEINRNTQDEDARRRRWAEARYQELVEAITAELR